MKKHVTALAAGLAVASTVALAGPAAAASQAKPLTLPGSLGTLTSNVWRTSGDGYISGNTRQWDYQVSAVYSGNYTVQRIRTTWYAQASLRSSASINLGISGSGVTVGSSSTWQNVRTPSKYWENSNGAKSSSWRSNIVEGPSIHYLSGTIYAVNTASVKLSADTRTFSITAGV